ncbi:hypothetical protein BLD25_05040 [Candidatus Gracilibacteria bacterium GN02-872]|nr:hypothetical protein BLD25_05040 [Candidatus Gracilibacteria bacterium GN02-872]
MKKNKIAVSLIESMVVVTILSIGLVGVFGFFIKSRNFLDGVSAKIQAMEMAREGIEAIENIRDTNWIRFPGNKQFCWNVLNYDSNCIKEKSGELPNSQNKMDRDGVKYILLNDNGSWKLEGKEIQGDFKDKLYRETFSVGQDEDGKYCQKIGEGEGRRKCSKKKGYFIRTIEITKPAGSENKMLVKSIVQWIDPSSSGVRKIEIENLLTNYKIDIDYFYKK